MTRLKTVGRWEDRWLAYPFQDMIDPEKDVSYLGAEGDRRREPPRPPLPQGEPARRRLLLQPGQDAPVAAPTCGPFPEQPGAELVRLPAVPARDGPEAPRHLAGVPHYCLKSKKDKANPAMRLGLAKAPIDLDTIIYF